MRSTLALSGAVLVALAASGGFAASPSSSTHFVSLEARAARAAAALPLQPRFAADYGSYGWLELTTTDLARLAAAGVPFTESADAGEVRIFDFRFDPLRDGEPTLAPGESAEGVGRGFRLVQFRGPVQDAWLRGLEAAGLPVLQYYPHHAYLTWAEATSAESAVDLPYVRWQGAFHPAYKIAPQLEGRTGVVRNVDVMFYDDGDIEGTLARIGELGGKVLQFHPAQPDRKFWDAIVELPADAIPAVSRLAPVLFLGHESPRPTLDDEMSDQILAGNHPGGTPVTGYSAHLGTLGVNGAGVIWAIIDTGVDYGHPDLGSHIVGGYEFPGSCATGNPGDDCVDGGHGTHVAGIVGGNATGLFADPAGFKYGLGVAPNVSFFAMNSLSAAAWPPAGGWQEHSKRAVLGSAIGGNNSWTTGEGANHGYQASERTHDLMVRDGNFDTAATAEPFIEVFSAGNSGPGSNTLTAPKEAKNLIVTAASQNFRVGSIDSLASFSSRGPAVDGRIVPTITSPGEEIASSRNDTGGLCSTAISGTNNLYAFCSGTSMASPHTSGAVALAAQWWRTFNAGADPSPAMAKALLVNSAVDMGTADIPNFGEGWGRINVTRMVQPGVPRVYKEQDPVRTYGATGDLYTLSVGVADLTKPFKVTVAWSDAAGAIGANPALVNNLDLEVDINAATYKGNVFSAGWSATGGVADVKNNLENVYILTPTTGAATIRVKFTQIAGDGVPYNGDTTDQDFALVCTNCVEQPDFTLVSTPADRRICAPTDANYSISVGSLMGYTDPVTLSLGGNPGGTTSGFSVSPVTPAGASVLTIGNTGAAAAGTYPLTLTGTAAGPNIKNLPLGLTIFTATPTAPTLTAPADGALDQGLRPTFQWTADPQADTYQIEIATDAGFTNLVLSQSGTGTSFTPGIDLASNTVYFWRVRDDNPCGQGATSLVSTFSTQALPGDCGIGTVPDPVFFENFDAGAGAWTHSGTADTWAISTTRNHSAPNSFLGVDSAAISDQRLVSPPIVLPAAGAGLTLQFWNYQSFEDSSGGCYDGALLEVTTNAGSTWTQVPGAAMLTDPYNGLISSGFSNPLAGLSAWCGDPQNWLNSVVDLSAYAGNTVQLRFRVGTDSSAGRSPDGWHLDDVKVQACVPDGTIFRDGFELGSLALWDANSN